MGSLLVCLILGRSAGAQPTPREPSPPPAAGPPTAHAAIAAYNGVQRWIRQWWIPGTAASSGLPPALGAALTLRLDGEVIGRGVDIAPDPAGSGGGDLLFVALADAFGDAQRRLPVQNDLLRDEATRAAAARITISLELAGALTPIDIDTYADADLVAAPMLDGVAVRFGDRLEAMFPSRMIEMNMLPSSALAALASAASGDSGMGLLEPKTLRERHGARVYRFPVIHVIQIAPGDSPTFLYRGARLIDVSDIDTAALRAMADAAAAHLFTHAWAGREPLGMTGGYLPWADRWEPEIAGPTEQAVAAYALLRYASTPGVDPVMAGDAASFAARIAADLAAVDALERSPAADPTPAAAFVVLVHELSPGGEPASAAVGAMREQCLAAVRSAVAASEDGSAVIAASVPGPARGLLALALASAGDSLAEPALRAAYRQTDPGQLVGLMPWLAWAELEVARGAAEVPAHIVLRRARDQAWAHQVLPTDMGADGFDLSGGFVFTAARRPLPSWHTARPATFLATMLGDARLTDPHEEPGELARLLTSVRFLRQLQVDRESSWPWERPGRALGGIRAAPWDQRQPIDATSFGLLAVTETLRSLAGLARGRVEGPPDGPRE